MGGGMEVGKVRSSNSGSPVQRSRAEGRGRGRERGGGASTGGQLEGGMDTAPRVGTLSGLRTVDCGLASSQHMKEATRDRRGGAL